MANKPDSTDIAGGLQGRPYIGIMFKCCRAYARIYLNREGTAYAGRCPRCGAKVNIRVGPEGSDSRFWTAE